MKKHEPPEPGDIPAVSPEQIEQLRARLAMVPPEPLFPAGTVSVCSECGGRMVTTNDLEESIVVPGLVYVVTRLPGARCLDCGSSELDGAALGVLGARFSRGTVADYETAVTHASGRTLGTYFKMDLVRVMGLTGSEQLLWKVVDRDRVLVEIARRDRKPTRSGLRPGRPRATSPQGRADATPRRPHKQIEA
jgi:hypothetical protein